MSLFTKDFNATSTRSLGNMHNPINHGILSKNIPKQMITGIANRCDWVIFDYNILNISNTDIPKNIFLNTMPIRKNSLENTFTYFIEDILHKLTSKFNLIIASSDNTFPNNFDKRYKPIPNIDKLLRILLNNIYLNKIFVENLDTIHEKMVPIPLGMNYIYKKYNFDIIPYDVNVRTKHVFCRHRLRNHIQFAERSLVTTFCKNEWKDFVFYLDDEITHEEYFDYLRQSIFTICVHGGGLDPCPKAFECIMCGSIPIIKRSALDEVWERFPVVLVDDWTIDTINETNLKIWYDKWKDFYINPDKRLEVINMMSMDYWWDIINNSFIV